MANMEFLLTVDFEMRSDGSGQLFEDVISPTEWFLDMATERNLVATIFLDICEYWAFGNSGNERYRQTLGTDPIKSIDKLLLKSIRQGHDVQLHAHPQWLNATWDKGIWNLDKDNYLSRLGMKETERIINEGKLALNHLLRSEFPGYSCIAFRAGNLNIQPEAAILSTLSKAGFIIDSTTAPGMKRNVGYHRYDYKNVPNFPFWRIDNTVTEESYSGRMWEVPLATVRISPWMRRSIKKSFATNSSFSSMASRPKPNQEGFKNKKSGFINMIEKLKWKSQVISIGTLPILNYRIFSGKNRYDLKPMVLVDHAYELSHRSQLLRGMDLVASLVRDGIANTLTFRKLAEHLCTRFNSNGCPPNDEINLENLS